MGREANAGPRDRGGAMDWDVIKAIGLVILVVLVLRDALTWFWKQNEIIKVLKDIRKSLDELKKGEDQK